VKDNYLTQNLIGSRIKELRLEKNATLAKMQEATGFSHSIISRWERGIYIPNAFGIIALADYFGVTTDYILCRTDDF